MTHIDFSRVVAACDGERLFLRFEKVEPRFGASTDPHHDEYRYEIDEATDLAVVGHHGGPHDERREDIVLALTICH